MDVTACSQNFAIPAISLAALDAQGAISRVIAYALSMWQGGGAFWKGSVGALRAAR